MRRKSIVIGLVIASVLFGCTIPLSILAIYHYNHIPKEADQKAVDPVQNGDSDTCGIKPNDLIKDSADKLSSCELLGKANLVITKLSDKYTILQDN